jgi:DNA mismatch repair ATPase MutS
LKDLDQIAELLYKRDVPDYLAGLSSVIEEFLSTPPLHHFVRHHAEPNHSDFAKLDGLFRNRNGKLKTILGIVYEMEVFQCLSTLINKNNFSLPEYAASGEVGIHLTGVFHPLLKDPVENNFDISGTKNLCLVTGANMAGKSTFLKAFSICVYLAHIGFPVPAQALKTTVFNGLITTINLSDSISEGYSHFFAEVKRIRQSSLLIKDRKRMVVVFDELFRGTNVKEAYEASLMITNAFSEIDSSVFLISTHIAEITGELQKRQNVFFNCFESELTGQVPTYNYLMKSGVSEERMGMSIIKNEKILEILKQAKSGEDLRT